MRVLVDGKRPRIESKGLRANVTMTTTLEWYEGALGDNGASERRSSGAYIFRSNGSESRAIGEPTTVTYQGAKIE